MNHIRPHLLKLQRHVMRVSLVVERRDVVLTASAKKAGLQCTALCKCEPAMINLSITYMACLGTSVGP